VHGVLLLDKPLGLSSNDALQKAKWLLRAEKAGHTGTLDPLATGVLPLCFGAATKFSQIHLDADKTYEAIAVLGVKTSTGDAEGEVISDARRCRPSRPRRLAQVRGQFTGAQRPGAADAQRAEEGRQGPVRIRPCRHRGRARAARHHVHALELALVQDEGRPALRFTACSKGTYIRTLGEDIGEALGCGAHLSMLRRVANGPVAIGQCMTLEALEALTTTSAWACCCRPKLLLEGHERVTLDEDAGRFLSGLRRRVHLARPQGGRVRPVAALLGTGHIKAGELIPGRLLSPIEIQQILQSREAIA
jgi:tRNA pseudouridine55 synthase